MLYIYIGSISPPHRDNTTFSKRFDRKEGLHHDTPLFRIQRTDEWVNIDSDSIVSFLCVCECVYLFFVYGIVVDGPTVWERG